MLAGSLLGIRCLQVTRHDARAGGVPVPWRGCWDGRGLWMLVMGLTRLETCELDTRAEAVHRRLGQQQRLGRRMHFDHHQPRLQALPAVTAAATREEM